MFHGRAAYKKGRRAQRAMRGMFLKHIVPSIAQALGLMLVIMSFVSPVPFHDSDTVSYTHLTLPTKA